ncbi:MAG: peptide chain release factor 1 [bacterium]
MFERLNGLEARYREIDELLSDPKVLADQERVKQLARERADLSPPVSTYREYRRVAQSIREAEQILASSSDSELSDLAKQELNDLGAKRLALEEKLKELLLPKDEHDTRNTIVEIRAGTGGEEAAVFAADLYRMYSRYAERKGWRIEEMSSNPTGLGGFREIVFLVKGEHVYSRLKFESGVHRVQRVPITESSGRIHTSAASVAVLPEAAELDVEIDEGDLRIDVFRSSGPGGQSVNTADSAVRITHLPTGLVVQCQEERSQLQNRAKALKVLRARLLDRARQEQETKIAAERKSQVGTGDRSAKIRTYNFPQNRVTDHRIGLTIHRLGEILDGDLSELIDALVMADRAERLKKAS